MTDGARAAPRDCPVCGSKLTLTRLSCRDCGTELSGAFEACEFCALGTDDREVLRVFLASRGNMKELERHLGVSYPTARARFDALLTRLGLSEKATDDPRVRTLEQLARGEIDIDEADRRLGQALAFLGAHGDMVDGGLASSSFAVIAYCSTCGTKTQPRVVGQQRLSVCEACDRIFFRNPKVVVTALIEDHGRVLLVRRDIEPGRGLWGLPGGFVDWDEHPEQAMVRECREEIAVRVEPLELLGVEHVRMDDEGIVILPYRARLVSGEPVAADEVQQVGWFSPDALPPLAFSSHRKVLQRWSQEVLARGAAQGFTIARKSIVTKTGDAGETGLLYGGRVRKNDPRTEAYGTVDEAISALGAARALIKDRARHAIILRLQSELFTVGAELATDAAEYGTLQEHFLVVTPELTSRVESEIADLERRITLPAAFVIPGGTRESAALDVARTVLRRAERQIVGLQQAGLLHNPEVLRYVNRLSDLLFMLARAEEGSAVKPLTGRRAARTPRAPARTPRAPRRRLRA